jgi:hypothetical protein
MAPRRDCSWKGRQHRASIYRQIRQSGNVRIALEVEAGGNPFVFRSDAAGRRCWQGSHTPRNGGGRFGYPLSRGCRRGVERDSRRHAEQFAFTEILRKLWQIDLEGTETDRGSPQVLSLDEFLLP